MSPKRQSWGSVRKLPSGRFQARYRVDGVLHTGPTTFRTKRDAEAFLAEVRTSLERGTWVNPAAGKVTLYEMPDGTRYLWLEEFAVIPGPGLRLFLSELTAAQYEELLADELPGDFVLSLEDLLLDPLRFDEGNQAYDVPREADLDRYNSVLIYSTELDLLYSFAPW